MKKPDFTKIKSWSKKKKMIAGIILVLVLLVGYKMLFGQSAPSAYPVATMPLMQRSLSETVSLKAPLEGTESVEVVSRLHSEITDIYVKEGDKVEKGQLLAKLDHADMQEAVDKAADALKLAQDRYNESIKQSQREYDKAIQDLEAAKSKYERMQKLYEEGAETMANLEDAEDAMQNAQRAVNAFNVQNGKVVGDASALQQLEIDRKELQSKRKDLGDSLIKSPINGTVTRVNVKVGRFADDTDDKKPMFIIENVDQLQMQVLVSEYDIGKIAEGQEAMITADVLQGASVRGVVSRISPTGELTAGSTTERVVPTEIKLLESNAKLIAGISAKAEITIASVENAFVVPIGAILQNPDNSTSIAVLADNSTVHLIPVTVGLESDLEAQIVADELKDGLPIIINPSAAFTEGMPVLAPAAAQ